MSPKTILHVEDDADDAFIIRRAFGKSGAPYTVFHVKDGEEAIRYLDGSAPFQERDKNPFPHAVLLDLKLPGRDGFDVLSWARSKPDLIELPIIVLTSSDRPEDLRRATALGATAYLNKSISCRSVLETLAHLI